MIYISLVGTQLMAVFNPLLTLVKQNGLPEQVILLGTEQVISRFERAIGVIASHKLLSGVAFKFYVVSNSLGKDSSGNPPAHERLKELAGSLNGRVFFNIAGGMNFQNAACAQVIDPGNCLFTYPDLEGVHLFDIAADGGAKDTLLPLPDPVDVEAIQGINLTMGDCSPTNLKLMKDALAAVGIRKLPEGCTENLKFAGIDFELVQNNGNTLCFFKLVSKSEELRQDVNPIATSRERTDDLYHRRICVFTPSNEVVDRAGYNSMGKIETYEYSNGGKTKKPDLRYLGTRIKQALGLIHFPKRTSSEVTSTEFLNGSIEGSCRKALVCFIGSDPMATLKAIWSHCPDTLWLLYAAGSGTNIERLKTAFEANKSFLPVKKIVFLSVDFPGRSVLDLPAPVAKEVEVNITPGTKCHAFFLTRWAVKNSMAVFSINNAHSKVESIPPGKELDVLLPSPVQLLKISGLDLKQDYETQDDLLLRRREMDAILRFLSLIIDDPTVIKTFPNQTIKLEKASYKKSGDFSGRIEFNDGQKPVFITLKNNYWLEQFVGHMLMRCGADDINLGVTEKLAPQSEAFIRKRSKCRVYIHRNEYDVLARFGDKICMVECKSGKITEKAVSDHAAGLNSTLPRFVVPFACRFKYAKEPKKTENGVWIFGHRTLTDVVALKKLINEAFAERRTTSPTGGPKN